MQDVVDKGRLTRAGDAGDRDQRAQREIDADVAQVVLPGTDHSELAGRVDRTANHRHGDLPAAGQERAGDRLLRVDQLLHRSGDDHLAAVFASPGTDVDDPVRGPDGVFVVLDDDERVAQIAQPGQRLDEPVVVPLVQPDGRLVEHVQHADEA